MAQQALSDFIDTIPSKLSLPTSANPDRVCWSPPSCPSAKSILMVQCLRRREAEAMAAVRAIAFARELGLSSDIIEEDFEVIIKALRSEEESFVSFGHLV
nr:hypothetical protein CFP56_36970 [Quercus suber]